MKVECLRNVNPIIGKEVGDGHWMTVGKAAGDPSSGHGRGHPHYAPLDTQDLGLPSDWNVWP